MKPNHVAIIMDGNGRWAQMRRLARDLAEGRPLAALAVHLQNVHALAERPADAPHELAERAQRRRVDDAYELRVLSAAPPPPPPALLPPDSPPK